MAYRVGVDIGGSFTDFAVFDERTDASLRSRFSPDPTGRARKSSKACGLAERYGVRPDEIAYFTHGTTVGVNSVIQRKGLKLALFVTEGFRDVLEVARLTIPDMFDLLSTRPAPLITRDRVFPIPGRIDADGPSRVTPVSRRASLRPLRRRSAAGAKAWSSSFLHTYRDGSHEAQAKAVRVSAARARTAGVPARARSGRSSASTSAPSPPLISGYVQPRVAHYLGSLQTGAARTSASRRLRGSPSPTAAS